MPKSRYGGNFLFVKLDAGAVLLLIYFLVNFFNSKAGMNSDGFSSFKVTDFLRDPPAIYGRSSHSVCKVIEL